MCKCTAHKICHCNKRIPHKHAKLIKAWADGAEIEWFDPEASCWKSTSSPGWLNHIDYRIKPEPKPDIAYFSCMRGENGSFDTSMLRLPTHNIKCIYDGGTGKLKSVEMI